MFPFNACLLGNRKLLWAGKEGIGFLVCLGGGRGLREQGQSLGFSAIRGQGQD